MTGTGPQPAGARPVVALRSEAGDALRSRARSRHPSARAHGAHLVGPLTRIGPAGLGITGAHAVVGAALLAVRGAQGRSQAGFAAAYGLAVEEVAAIEGGAVAPADVPAPVRLLTPFPVLVAALQAAEERRPSSSGRGPSG